MSLATFYNNPDLGDGFNIWPHSWRSQPHRGLDFLKASGTPIPSVNSGVVVISEWNPYLGNIVEVRGDDGVYMGYCHLSQPGKAVGDRVSIGDTIGPVGNTGSQSNGAHLHITKGDREGAVRGASISYLSDPWPCIQLAINNNIQKTLEESMSNPIISVPDSRGTLYIGTDRGDFVPYATPKAANSRGIISKVFYGGPGGTTDTIPALSWVDFEVAKTVWRQMCTGK